MILLKTPQQYALAGCLLFAATNVFAVPVFFNDREYSAFADVEVGNNSSGLVDKTNPPDPLPLLASASLANGSNSAMASGNANTGQLSVSTSVSSLNLFTGAASGAGFVSEFTGTGGSVKFVIDFLNSSNVGDTGFAGANLFVTLMSGSTTLFDQILDSSQSIAQSFVLASGSSNIFNIQLISIADAFGDGQITAFGSNVASANFSLDATPAVAISEPHMASLVLGGLGLLAWSRRSITRPTPI